MSVWLLTSGDGSDGSEIRVHGVFSSMEVAEFAKREFEADRLRPDGSMYHFTADVEEWPVDDGLCNVPY